MAKLNHPQARRVFMEVADLPDARRAAALDRACGDDAALRAAVESLLRADASVDEYADAQTGAAPPVDAPTFEPPSAPADASTIDDAPRERAGEMIGRYKLLQPIGEGGFGTVWMCEQREPVKRRVALKIIKLGMDTKQVIARFEAERAYEASRAAYGAKDLDTIQHLRHLGNVYYRQGRSDEALRAYQEAYDVRLEALGEAHRKTLISLNDLAVTYADQGDLEAAEPLSLRYLELTRQHLGPDDPETANAVANVGWLYRDLGRYEDAERMFLDARAMDVEIYGEHSRSVYTAERNLGRLYQVMNRGDEAIGPLESALKGYKAILGADHDQTLSCAIHLARAYVERGEYERARDLFREGRDGLAAQRGDDDQLVRAATIGLARCLLALGDCPAARRTIALVTTTEGLSDAVAEERSTALAELAERCPE